MALLTRINGIPLYSTVNEALAYADAERIQGYHTHRYKNIVGYMGGVNHEQSKQSSGSISTQQQQQITAQQQLPQSLQTTSNYTAIATTTTTTTPTYNAPTRDFSGEQPEPSEQQPRSDDDYTP